MQTWATQHPRVWVILAEKAQADIWSRGANGFEVIAGVKGISDSPRFEEKFSEWLLSARDQDALDRIILIAPEEILRIFWEAMPTDVLACMAAEIPKDFSGLSQSERKKILEKMICV